MADIKLTAFIEDTVRAQSGVRQCLAPQCERGAHAKGMCDGHYRQIRKGNPIRPLDPRFSSGVSVEDRMGAMTDKSR